MSTDINVSYVTSFVESVKNVDTRYIEYYVKRKVYNTISFRQTLISKYIQKSLLIYKYASGGIYHNIIVVLDNIIAVLDIHIHHFD